jgi:hypothetical protein
LQDLIPYNRHTGRGGDTGHPPGSRVDVTARWTKYTSPNTPRRWLNEPDGARGRFLVAGERWRWMHAFRPWRSTSQHGRTVNPHDTPQPGAGGWPSQVSPIAFDINSTWDDNVRHDGTITLMYAGDCGTGRKHTDVPFLWDEWNCLWWDVLWKTDCTGLARVWLTNRLRGPDKLPLVDFKNIRTIRDDPLLGDAVDVWQGVYGKVYAGTPDTVTDLTGGHFGKEWTDVWTDVPEFVSTWGSDKSSIVRDHGTLRGDAIVVPQEIADAIGNVPPTPPPLEADFTWTPAEPKVGEPVTFKVTDPDPEVVYTWDRTLDGVLDWQGETYTYPYQSPGTKTMVLYANGQTAAKHDLTVLPPPPPPVDPLELRIVSQTATAITLGWKPPLDQEGYVATLDGSQMLTDGKRHGSLSEIAKAVKIGKKQDGRKHRYGVDILGVTVSSDLEA